MLEQPKGEKITTAALAARLDVSEAALYRHFASKAQMFEGLIEFIESSVFGLINQIAEREERGVDQAHAILQMLLAFAGQQSRHDAGADRRRAGRRGRAPAAAHEPVLRQGRTGAANRRCAWRSPQGHGQRSRRRRARQPAGQLRDRPLAPLRQERLQTAIRPKARRCSWRCCWPRDRRWHRHEHRRMSSPCSTTPAPPTPRTRARACTRGHAGTLACADAAGWPQLLAEMQAGAGARPVRGAAADLRTGRPPARHRRARAVDGAAGAGAAVRALRPADRRRRSTPGWRRARRQRRSRPASPRITRQRRPRPQFTRAHRRASTTTSPPATPTRSTTPTACASTPSARCARCTRACARASRCRTARWSALPDGGAVLSLSPELFVRHAGGELLARPMKGTAPASGDDSARMRSRAAALAADTKNRAENLMIVDLLRNDLGRVAETGSVEVPALFEVQRYSSVLQMTSTVRARAARPTPRWPRSSPRSIPAARSPARPSGAPWRSSANWNRHAARHLHRRDRLVRSAGSRRSALGDFCLSVPIRTLALQAPADGVRRGEMGVGAGIVFDSDARDEYAECQLKARFLTGLANDFETVRDHPRQPRRRLPPSASATWRAWRRRARYFGFPFDARGGTRRDRCDACAGAARRRCIACGWRSAPTASKFSVQAAPLAPLQEPVRLLLADEATCSADDLFLRHKTSIAHALRRGLARGRGAGRLRHPVLQRARRTDRRRPQQCVRAARRPLVHAAAVVRRAAGRDARGAAGAPAWHASETRDHARHAGQRGGHHRVQCPARPLARGAARHALSTRAVALPAGAMRAYADSFCISAVQVGLAFEADARQVRHRDVAVLDLHAIREAAERLEQVRIATRCRRGPGRRRCSATSGGRRAGCSGWPTSRAPCSMSSVRRYSTRP